MAQFDFQSHFPYIGAAILAFGLMVLGVLQIKKSAMDRALYLSLVVFSVVLVLIGACMLLFIPLWATARQG